MPGFENFTQQPVNSKISPVTPGNITDLFMRPVLNNADGSYSTTRSMSFNENGKEVLIPTVVNGKALDPQQAIDYYKRTGQHLGMFNTPQEADQYAQDLHNQQALYMELYPLLKLFGR